MLPLLADTLSAVNTVLKLVNRRQNAEVKPSAPNPTGIEPASGVPLSLPSVDNTNTCWLAVILFICGKFYRVLYIADIKYNWHNKMAGRLINRVDQYDRVAMFDSVVGGLVNRIKDQISGTESARTIRKYASFQAQGVVANFLQGGANPMIYIINGELGQITKAWVQFTIQVANAPVQLLPAFMWIDRLQSFKDSTNAKGQDPTWANVLFAYGNLTPSQFDTMARSMLYNPDDAWTVKPLQVGTYNVQVNKNILYKKVGGI